MPDLSEPTSPPASGVDWRRLFAQRTAEAARQVAAGDAVALAAWEAARAVLEQSEERLAGRTAELEVLQALGRRCAEAMRPGQLTVKGKDAAKLWQWLGTGTFSATRQAARARSAAPA